MIYSVRGKLILKEPNFAVIECGGVGYGCRTSYSTVAQLGETGSETMLYTYLYVREDAVELFGFVSQQELSCFKLLISVSGVGPKAAISILSDVRVAQRNGLGQRRRIRSCFCRSFGLTRRGARSAYGTRIFAGRDSAYPAQARSLAPDTGSHQGDSQDNGGKKSAIIVRQVH